MFGIGKGPRKSTYNWFINIHYGAYALIHPQTPKSQCLQWGRLTQSTIIPFGTVTVTGDTVIHESLSISLYSFNLQGGSIDNTSVPHSEHHLQHYSDFLALHWPVCISDGAKLISLMVPHSFAVNYFVFWMEKWSSTSIDIPIKLLMFWIKGTLRIFVDHSV